MTLVIDASVALKWVIEEEDSATAQEVLSSRHRLAAPEFLWVECANALWSKARRKLLRWEDGLAAYGSLEKVGLVRIPIGYLVAPALEIARALDHPIYDCLYLAAALSEGGAVLTADERFAAAARKHPAYANHVRLLGEA